ncbi:NAD-dependent epimerase/dehydratase family protein [Chloroflexota bacterium]
MKILVTGGTGFIGSHLVNFIREKEYTVRCLVRPTSNNDILRDIGVEVVHGDITDMDSLFPALDGVDIVYHLAAALDARNFSDATYDNTNVQGTRCLIEAAINNGGIRRFLYCSSVGVFTPSKQTIGEDAPYYQNPTNSYHRTKQEAEIIVRSYMERGNIPVTIIYPAAIVYGPRDFSNLLGMFRMISKGRYFIIGKGKNHIHQIYVKDLVRGMWMAGQSEEAAGQSYILADKTPATIQMLSEAIAKAVGKKLLPFHMPTILARMLAMPIETFGHIGRFSPPLSQPRIDTLTANRLYCTEKAFNQLGFITEADLEESLRETAAWYIDNGHI